MRISASTRFARVNQRMEGGRPSCLVFIIDRMRCHLPSIASALNSDLQSKVALQDNDEEAGDGSDRAEI